MTELGENTCQGSFVNEVMSWLDAQGLSYLAWSWNVNGACTPGSDSDSRPWSLVSDYYTGEPNSDYARAFHDRFMALAPASGQLDRLARCFGRRFVGRRLSFFCRRILWPRHGRRDDRLGLG